MPRRASVSSWSGRRRRRNSTCDHVCRAEALPHIGSLPLTFAGPTPCPHPVTLIAFCRAEALPHIRSHLTLCRAEALPHNILHSHGAGDSYPAPLAPPPAAPPPPPPPPALAPAPADDVLACVPRNATNDALRSSSTRAAA